MLFAQYLDELKKIRLLEPEEEAALWRGFKADGCLDCRRRLIEHYQPLVFKEAMRWRAREQVVMDLIQEGTVGLIEAVENFEPERGVAFSLYAPHRIRGRMLSYIEREGKREWASIDSPAGEIDGDTLADRLVDEAAPVPEQAERNFLIEQVLQALGRLPAKEQLVLSGMYLQEREPKQLAEALDMSLSHLYRLQKQGIRRVRGMLSRLMHELKVK
ncbi:sigma-70 family RNA polymerase sigma factor [Sporolituus thermophilus]|uniref:RNA polymerase sporulation-specific sigma factor n=1 Tax=Sporolituus thermophilus DSM 23256 TaxID=1123285 RepID=A0A1G7HFI5_9FIRM|nr:sigma-70 family RNA polymerase sigma factor [Sporolituus thermophilus]SDE99131.1 RNA polymerase sporulation-specific sigma factor [Sporolituus thermophilus DSM 23256]